MSKSKIEEIINICLKSNAFFIRILSYAIQHCFVSFWNFEYTCVYFIRSLKYTVYSNIAKYNSAIYFSDIIDSCQQLKALFKISAEGPPFTHILWLGKNWVTWNSCLWDGSKSLTNMKIPPLHVHKPKTVVVETMLVIYG